MARVAAGRQVDRRFKLRVAAGEIEHHAVALDGQGQGDAARIAADRILIHVVGEEIVAVGQAAHQIAGLGFGIVE